MLLSVATAGGERGYKCFEVYVSVPLGRGCQGMTDQVDGDTASFSRDPKIISCSKKHNDMTNNNFHTAFATVLPYSTVDA